MALQSRVVNGSLTEIYAGGGNFVTEAFTTNFHTFAPKRILLDGQSADDYKEVTPAERSAIEAADAKWEEWPESTIAEWNTACGSDGGYNAKTGFGELNGLTDLTLSDARRILVYGKKALGYFAYAAYYNTEGCRTNLPPLGIDTIQAECPELVRGNKQIEVLRIHPESNYKAPINYRTNIRRGGLALYAPNLRQIIGRFSIASANCEGIFYDAAKLEDFRLVSLDGSISLQWSPLVNLESFAYMIEHASNTSPITITVHADVYAKLADESNTDWHALMTSAAAKNITFATT